MREILFRGKKFETSVFDETDWVYGSLIDSGNHEQVAIYPWFDEACTMSVRQLVYTRMEAVNPSTVGQYTGLKDKNGKRIFEGDIVRIEERGHVAEGGKIVFRNGYPGGWIITDKTEEANCSLAWRSCVEVIGNIHDNPELLEVEG